MSILTKPSKRMLVLTVGDRKDFIENFNKKMPSPKILELSDRVMKITKWVK